jgi:succinyl-diaminopimelate desuccinylase
LGVIGMEGDTVKAVLDIRYPVSCTEGQVLAGISSVLPGHITLVSQGGKGPLHVEADSELIKILQRVYEKHTGEEAELISIGGGTYARALDNGVAFGPVFPGQPELAHQPDEFISIGHLSKLMAIYADAISKLADMGGE